MIYCDYLFIPQILSFSQRSLKWNGGHLFRGEGVGLGPSKKPGVILSGQIKIFHRLPSSRALGPLQAQPNAHL